MTRCWLTPSHIYYSGPLIFTWGFLPRSSINSVLLTQEKNMVRTYTHVFCRAPSSPCFPVPSQNNKTSVFACTEASWVLSQMVLMTCAPAETAPSFALDWWHMLRCRAISGAQPPPVSERHPCNPSTVVTQWQRQTLNKQRASFSLHCISICFFLSGLHPLPPSVAVSPCYFTLPYVHPSPAFPPLMSPPSPTWWMTLCFSD